MNQEEQRPEHFQGYNEWDEDEIQLIDYLRVIWKWKWMIAGGTVICCILAIVFTLLMPKKYEVVMAIEPGIVGFNDRLGYIYMDSDENIRKRINEQSYNRRIQKKLDLDPAVIKFKFTTDENTKAKNKANLVKVKSLWKEGNTETGMKVSNQLVEFLREDYNEIIVERKSEYDKQIANKENAIEKIEIEKKDIDRLIEQKRNEIKKVETQGKILAQNIASKQNEIDKVEIQRKGIGNEIIKKQNEIGKIETRRKDIDKEIALKVSSIEKLKGQTNLQRETLKETLERIKALTAEAGDVKENTRKIIEQRNNYLKDNKNGEGISLLLYSTTIQQDVAYFNQLNNQIHDLRKDQMKLEAEIENLSKDIDDVRTEIERLELLKTEGLQTQIDDITAEINGLKLKKSEGMDAEINDIKNAIDNLELQKTEVIQANINDIENEIDKLKLERNEEMKVKENNIRSEIKMLQLKMQVIDNMKIVQPPEVSQRPVEPRKRIIVALSAFAGFFFLMFLAFFIEYVRNASKPDSSSKVKGERRGSGMGYQLLVIC